MSKETFGKTQNYVLKWQFVFDEKYKVSECRKIINTHTGAILKQSLNGYTVGYWFGKRFISKKKLNNYVQLIPTYNLPF